MWADLAAFIFKVFQHMSIPEGVSAASLPTRLLSNPIKKHGT